MKLEHHEAAERAARLVLDSMRDGERLLRVRKDGESSILGFLDDNAFFIEALIDLYETGFDVSYLEAARRLADIVLERFSDEQETGLYFTSADHELVLTRRKDPFDGAVPSPIGVMVLNLLRLERLVGVQAYGERARAVLLDVSAAVARVPMGFGSTLIAIDFLLHPPVELAIVGDLASPAADKLFAGIHSGFLPSRVLAASSNPPPEELARSLPLLEGKGHDGTNPRLYICRDYACEEPLDEPQGLRERLPFVSFPEG